MFENCLHKNLMVLNAKKCYYMCFGKGSQSGLFIFIGIKKKQFWVDNGLRFKPHIRNMGKKAAQKLGALNRIAS